MAFRLEDIHDLSAVSTGSCHQKHELEDRGKVECHSNKHFEDKSEKHDDPVSLLHSPRRHVLNSDLAIHGVEECEEKEADKGEDPPAFERCFEPFCHVSSAWHLALWARRKCLH